MMPVMLWMDLGLGSYLDFCLMIFDGKIEYFWTMILILKAAVVSIYTQYTINIFMDFHDEHFKIIVKIAGL